jgi:hypothetical protein
MLCVSYYSTNITNINDTRKFFAKYFSRECVSVCAKGVWVCETSRACVSVKLNRTVVTVITEWVCLYVVNHLAPYLQSGEGDVPCQPYIANITYVPQIKKYFDNFISKKCTW